MAIGKSGNRLLDYPVTQLPDSSSLLIRPCDDDGRSIDVEDATRRGVRRVERHRAEQIGQPRVVVEAEAEEFGDLQEVRDRGVGLERARDRADEIPPRVVQLLL